MKGFTFTELAILGEEKAERLFKSESLGLIRSFYKKMPDGKWSSDDEKKWDDFLLLVSEREFDNILMFRFINKENPVGTWNEKFTNRCYGICSLMYSREETYRKLEVFFGESTSDLCFIK